MKQSWLSASGAVLLAAMQFLGSVSTSSAEDYSLSEIAAAWLAGPHGDYRAPAFTHWNEDGAVPQACAACHSETGMLDYLGQDGSAALSVEHPATINTVIGCASCHVAEAEALDAVPFPSGVTVSALGASATCNVCHQGRASTDSVVSATEGLDADIVSAELTFINVHYGVAAAVLQGADVRGGFQYDGESYLGRFNHVPSANTCADCHDPHSTEVAVEGCVTCHQGVADIRAIRTRHADFDGDGIRDGGIGDEIAGLHGMLYDAIQTYAAQVSGTPVGYAERFPYFFTDTNANGVIDAEEAAFPNRYASWTPRLLKAAYNYQVVAKDKAAWVHNPGYALQLLHDSVVDLADQIELDTSALMRP